MDASDPWWWIPPSLLQIDWCLRPWSQCPWHPRTRRRVEYPPAPCLHPWECTDVQGVPPLPSYQPPQCHSSYNKSKRQTRKRCASEQTRLVQVMNLNVLHCAPSSKTERR